MEVSFNIEEYLSEQEVENIVRNEYVYAIRGRIDNYMKRNSIADIIDYAARKIAVEIISDEYPNLHDKIAEKAIELIDKLEAYQVFGTDYGTNEPKKAQIVINECVEELRPHIKKKLDEIIEDNLDADILIDSVVDEFYNRLSKQLCK